MHDRLDLLCDHGLPRVGAQPEGRDVEQRRHLDLHCRGRHRVAKADIELQANDGRGDARMDDHTDAAIGLLLADQRDSERLLVEANTVFADIDRQDVPEHGADGADAWIAKAKQVDIAGRPVRFARPDREQRRALEHELPSVRRLRQPMEEALVRVSRQDQLEVLTACGCVAEQARANGRRDIGRWPGHARASR